MPDSQGPEFSVVIPVFNEEECIVGVLNELRDALDGSGLKNWECVVVDDCSRDRTSKLALKMASEDARIRVLGLNPNSGQSAALDAGFRNARGQFIGMMDGDGQNDPADFPRLLNHLKQRNLDVMCGIRSKRRDNLWRRLVSFVANSIRNWATSDEVTDTGCSLRVMKCEYVRRLKMYRGLHRFLPTLLRLEGARIGEIPVNHRPRRAGKSKYTLRNRASALRDLFAVQWMRRRQLRYEVRSLTD
jgi:glycosyltransferase involved in cell wall biosynthesis